MTAFAYMFSNAYGTGFWNTVKDFWGYNQKEANKQQTMNTIDYNEYLKRGYERQLADWKKNVPNRTIRYPELSFPGHIRGLDTGSVNALLGYDITSSNYNSNLYGRAYGLYGVGGRLSRYI